MHEIITYQMRMMNGGSTTKHNMYGRLNQKMCDGYGCTRTIQKLIGSFTAVCPNTLTARSTGRRHRVLLQRILNAPYMYFWSLSAKQINVRIKLKKESSTLHSSTAQLAICLGLLSLSRYAIIFIFNHNPLFLSIN